MRRPAAALLALVVVMICAAAPTAWAGTTSPAPRAWAGAASADPEPARIAVIGVTGLRWDDLGALTPTLQRLAGQGSVGALSVKTAAARDCRADVWLTLGAGDRARAGSGGRESCPDAVPGLEVLPQIRADVATLPRDAVVGELAVALGAGCVTAEGPGALLSIAGAATGAASGGCPRGRGTVRLVDAGIVHHDGRRRGDLAAADDRVSRALDGVGTVLVVGAGESGRDLEHLHVALAVGPSFGRGALVSASTRRTPYVQVIDVAPTILHLLGLPQPAAMSGQPWRTSGAAPSRARLADLDRRARGMRELTVPFFVGLVALIALVLGSALATGRTGRVRTVRTVRALRLAALVATAGPVAFFLANLVPWWSQEPRWPALFGAVALADVLVVGAGLLGPWRRAALGPVGVVCGLTALVLSGDLLTGAHLQIDSLAGYSSLVAGRFAGIGNVAFAVLAAAALLATACAVSGRSRRTTLVVCSVVGLFTVAVDGSPSWGSDVGGVLALVPGFAVLALLASRLRVSLSRLVLAVIAAGALVTGFALLDYSRPAPSRTHLGRFVEQVLHGEAGTVIGRKAGANLDLLLHSPLTALVPLLVLAVALVVLRPRGAVAVVLDRTPAWRAGLVSVLAMALVGFLTNDSGVAIPALALAIAVPAAVFVALSGASPA